MYYTYRGKDYTDIDKLCRAVVRKDKALVKAIHDKEEDLTYLMCCPSVRYSYYFNIETNGFFRQYLTWKLLVKWEWDLFNITWGFMKPERNV